MKEKKISSLHYLWNKNGYEPEIEFTLSKTPEGFHMHIVVKETDPLREKKEHFLHVHEDSCAEWFVNFAPDICDRYFNFEVNANGCMNVAFKKDRYDSIKLKLEDVEALNIKAKVLDDRWEVDYDVPFAFIRSFIAGYEFKEGMTIKSNFYKCGDHTANPHYGMWNIVEGENPDFHRPEFFKEIVLD